jgi:hypothetical protein
MQWRSDMLYCASKKAALTITFGEPNAARDSGTLAYASPYKGSYIVVYFTRLRGTVSPENVSAILSSGPAKQQIG